MVKNTPHNESSQLFEELKNLPEASQNKLIEIYGEKQIALVELEFKKIELQQKSKY